MKDYYIIRGGRLRREENTLYLEFPEGEKKAIPVNDVRSIHILGEMDFNTKLLIFLSQHGIPIHIYNYYGYYSGSFYPREKLLSGFLLVRQVQHYIEPEKRLKIAKEIVGGAIHNILSNLHYYKKQGKPVDEFIDFITKEGQRLKDVNSVAEAMGLEGRCRENYYGSFKHFLREGFEIEKRTRMPPHNMINCLISFGNSLLYGTILTEIYHTQLTPTISYLHEPGERRYSLALDLSEIFKPILIDRLVFSLINNRMVKEEQFFEELNGCYLKDSGKKLFITEYEKRLSSTVMHKGLKRHVSYKRLIRLECYKLIKHLLGEGSYTALKAPM
ncbi:MAG: type I-B CRISPR-associated endonuclease Cas1b [Nitrososphaerales archaeon]